MLKLNISKVQLSFPDAIQKRPYWVVWKAVPRGERITKIPYQPNGQPAESNDPSTWSEFTACVAAYQTGKWDGIGCMIRDPFCAVDFDHVRDPKSGKVEAWAAEAIKKLNSYTELSPSGEGFHVWCLGTVPESARKRCGRVEIYSNVRYFTVTGEWIGTHYKDLEIPKQCNEIPETFAASIINLDPQYKASSTPAGPVQSTKTTMQKFYLLQQGMWKEAGYPSQSDADLAYCGRLAEIFAGDPLKMDESFRKSALMREKWDVKHGADTYGNLTISKALANYKAKPTPRARIRGAKDYKIRSIQWMWKYRVPLGKMTLFSGLMDMGKSVVSLDIAARLTTGREWPDGKPNIIPPSSVLMFVSEDDPADTVIPRFLAAGGDINKLYFYEMTELISPEKTTDVMFSLDKDLEQLSKHLLEVTDTRLIIFDPISAYFGTNKNINSEQDVREVLGNLVRLLQETNLASISLAHFNKSVGVAASQKTIGGTALSAIHRMGWAFLPDDEVKDNKHMAKLKGNLAPPHVKGLKYTTESVNVPMPREDGEPEENEQPKVKWLGESGVNPDEVLERSKEAGIPELTSCKKWLRELLKDGRKLVGECISLGKVEGFSEGTVKRASREMKLIKDHEGKQYFWRLPQQEQSQMF